MLLPKRQKHRRVRKGRIRGVATSSNYIAFGDFALQAQGQQPFHHSRFIKSRNVPHISP